MIQSKERVRQAWSSNAALSCSAFFAIDAIARLSRSLFALRSSVHRASKTSASFLSCCSRLHLASTCSSFTRAVCKTEAPRSRALKTIGCHPSRNLHSCSNDYFACRHFCKSFKHCREMKKDIFRQEDLSKQLYSIGTHCSVESSLHVNNATADC